MLDAPWDLLVVDEAHHLAWSPEAASPRYRMVEQLAAAIPGVILLTATPEQLGRSGHFARLRLLDPQRYHDLDGYLAEADTLPGAVENRRQAAGRRSAGRSTARHPRRGLRRRRSH